MATLNIKKFKKALIGSMGIYAVIAKRCGVDRSAVTKYIQRHPELLEAIEHEKEQMIDIAENQLMKAITAGDHKSVKFFLKTKGKNRGYVQKQEILHTGSVNEPVDIRIIMPKDEDRHKTNEEAE